MGLLIPRVWTLLSLATIASAACHYLWRGRLLAVGWRACLGWLFLSLALSLLFVLLRPALLLLTGGIVVADVFSQGSVDMPVQVSANVVRMLLCCQWVLRSQIARARDVVKESLLNRKQLRPTKPEERLRSRTWYKGCLTKNRQ